ncbi:S9 family peptidase [Paracoccus denitrificans]|jgi:dipeptidyl aminopeptidase/acylaminoacyl peptidase|uniref:Peptidase S9, prolyl oligopeptidase active site domain protein n=1 Tax=Paracoccus denitrificans (strain Pd 1222) TaxID=318586 RepID=A1BAZ8_PARDP|nr:DPP IV N-terminal domain-containing protein [Paracoccus denitrificans]ABL72692.1 peptidase S9, prolyl oligopeptidase active site domain protein [Paracoccus denitrificans PD1222]MBB4629290.1 dipeptidyl aminopeptidase/acylaminoacyl peptidase [Paracoccus denitrificans]MCU7430309.1 DPP IV N-terminal domain-containing protein [Paracoccus denitrificans]QAR29662.1 S9 family peptidase [Paracoccus denitrificans]UPV98563.1 DPP IV N-terminal domain-containing protein [Paracoccus denitrificans]
MLANGSSTGTDPHERARYLASGLRNVRVFNDTVRPFWSDDGKLFSYCRRTPDGTDYLLVEAGTGRVAPLFDRKALAARIAALPVAPEAAEPVDVRLARDATAIEFRLDERLWRATRDGLVLTDLGPVAAPAENVAPDHSARLVIRDHNLWLVDHSGKRPLTSDGEAGNGYGGFLGFDYNLAEARCPPIALWSPDSSRIATLRTDLRQVPLAHLIEAIPPDGSRPRLHSFPYPVPGDEHGALSELWFIDRNGQRVPARMDRLVSFGANPLISYPAWWSDNGGHFYLHEGSRDGDRLDFWQVDTATGDTRRLVIEEGPAAGRPCFSPSPQPQVLRDGRILWSSMADGWRHLYFVEPGDPRSRRRITAGGWNVVSILHVDEDAETVLFAAAGREPRLDPYYLQVYSIRFDGTDLRRLTHQDLNHDLSLPSRALTQVPAGSGRYPNGTSPDGTFFVAAHEAPDRPPVSALYDRNGRVVTTLEHADAGAAWPADMPLPEPFHVQALDGETELWGVLYKPPGFDPEKSYPVIDVIYGGPQVFMAPKSFGQTTYARYAEGLAAAGFVTLLLDGPGTPGRSRDFWLHSHGRMESCGGLADHVTAIRSLAADRPWMDIAEGVGLTGFSGGGYATVRGMAVHPDFFTVGVSICGNHDVSLYIANWAEMFQGMDAGSRRGLASADVADRIAGKLFLVQGEMDDNVQPSQMLRLVDALVKADADFDMLIVPGAGHGVAFHPYALRRTVDYFLRHLAGRE